MTPLRTPRRGLTCFLSLLSIVFLTGPASPASSREAATTISLRSIVLDLNRPHPELPEGLRAAPADVSSEYQLVKFAAPVTAAERAALESEARVYTYLPHFTYLVRAPSGATSATLRARVGASWVGPYHPAYKLSPSLAKAVKGPGDELQIVMAHIYPDADLDAVLGRVRGLGIAEIAGSADAGLFQRARLLLTRAEIARFQHGLARIPEVFWIDVEPRRVLLNDTTVWVGQTGLDGGMETKVFEHGIYGEGQVIGVLDTGIDPSMCYFGEGDLTLPPINPCDGGTLADPDRRKVIAVNFLWSADCAGGVDLDEWDDNDHGTHVAGSAAADDPATPLAHDPGDGMAPGAQLVIQDGGFGPDNCADLPGLGCPVVDLKPLFQQAYDQGARLHTNSWGDQENAAEVNVYTAGSQDADQFMWDNKDFLLFFAAGNAGPGMGSVLSPSTAKSVVSVGATQRGVAASAMAGFSSCGPTDDGRFKPDLTVPGVSILSANSDNNAESQNCNLTSLSGTSMASPAAAGLGALVRQYFVDGWYPSGGAVARDGFVPSAALVKAALVNSGEDMAGVGPIPNNCQGWGRALLDDALYFDGDTRRLWIHDEPEGFARGAGGEVQSFVFEVLSDSEPLEVTLAWTDFPSTPAANPHLNNDLDLEVVHATVTYPGNFLIGGESFGGGPPDRLNTVEQVLLLSPTPGEYTVNVRSFNVPDGPQPFALVVTGDVVISGAIFTDGFESGDTSAWTPSP